MPLERQVGECIHLPGRLLQEVLSKRGLARVIRDPHGRWDLREAVACQRRLCERVDPRDDVGSVRRVAGVDVSYARGDTDLYAAVVTLDASTLDPLETATAVGRPGLATPESTPCSDRVRSVPRPALPGTRPHEVRWFVTWSQFR